MSATDVTDARRNIAVDGALIAKLQDYHIDVVGAVPVFGKTEPWARFPHTKR